MIVNFLFANAVATLILMLAAWLTAIKLKNNVVADIAWGLGFVVIAVISFMQSFMMTRNLLITLLTLCWGFRLSSHILVRSLGKPEDFRYAKMRSSWGDRQKMASLTKVFLPQWALMFIVAGPILWTHYANIEPGMTLLDRWGILLWIIGFTWESIADLQMTLFKRNPSNKGRVMTKGLWRYSRHPNYFGEMLVWWGFFLIALSVRNGQWTIISPILIGILLTKVSGVPMLEKKYTGNDEYESYKTATNAIVPWIPKNRGS